MIFANPITLAIIGIPLIAAACGLGILIAFWVAVCRRRTAQWACDWRHLGIDAALGACGFIGGAIVSATLPWSDTYDAGDGWHLTNMYPYFWQTIWPSPPCVRRSSRRSARGGLPEDPERGPAAVETHGRKALGVLEQPLIRE